jgi:hypothetical protein
MRCVAIVLYVGINVSEEHATSIFSLEDVPPKRWYTPVSEDVPLTPCRRQGGEEYSSYSFLTSALNAGERSASRPGRALLPGKDPPPRDTHWIGYASERVWTPRAQEKSSAWDQTPVVQSAVRHYNDMSTHGIITTENTSIHIIRNTIWRTEHFHSDSSHDRDSELDSSRLLSSESVT